MRSEDSNTRDARRIVLLGANARLDEKLYMFGALDEKRKRGPLQCTKKMDKYWIMRQGSGSAAV